MGSPAARRAGTAAATSPMANARLMPSTMASGWTRSWTTKPAGETLDVQGGIQ